MLITIENRYTLFYTLQRGANFSSSIHYNISFLNASQQNVNFILKTKNQIKYFFQL